MATDLKQTQFANDRRKWERLPIPVPVFLRSKNERGEDIVEFATAANISGGGAMIVSRRYFPLGARIVMEIPSAPILLPPLLSNSKRTLSAELIRINHLDRYCLLALKFARPLVSPSASTKLLGRK